MKIRNIFLMFCLLPNFIGCMHYKNSTQDYKLGTKENIEKSKRIQRDLQSVKSGVYGFNDLNKDHQNDDVQDAEGRYKLKDAEGNLVLASRKQLTPLLLNGFEFQDPNFQALYDAHLKLGSDAQSAAFAGQSGVMESIPGLKWGMDKITDNFGTKAGKASNIALDVIKQTEQKTAATLGTVAGIGMQLIILFFVCRFLIKFLLKNKLRGDIV